MAPRPRAQLGLTLSEGASSAQRLNERMLQAQKERSLEAPAAKRVKGYEAV
jgi:hypothetical protein